MEIQKSVKVTMNRCLKCNYEWVKRVQLPKQCPRCKQYGWDNKKTKV